MNDATKRAIERMKTAGEKSAKESIWQRNHFARERAERCEGQAHAFKEAIRMLEEEHAKEPAA